MFLAMETIFYKFIVAGEPKNKVMIKVVGDENVKFLWELICLMKITAATMLCPQRCF